MPGSASGRCLSARRRCNEADSFCRLLHPPGAFPHAALAVLGTRDDIAVTELCLMDEPFQYFSEGFFAQRERLLAAKELDHPRFRYAHQFAEADAIVIAAPFWDLAFPALLKVYIENVSVEGITFGCNASGCFGICRAERMLFLTTRGGSYDGAPDEMGARYLEALCGFFGIPRFDCVAADGLDLGLRPVEEILAEAKAKAAALAAAL